MIDRLKAGRRDFMYRIQEGKDREKNILLIPAMLDAHFPLLQYAFYSKNYHPIILVSEHMEGNGKNIKLRARPFHWRQQL